MLPTIAVETTPNANVIPQDDATQSRQYSSSCRASLRTASERELLDSLMNPDERGNQSAILSELFDRYYQRVFTWCWHNCGDRDLALDLTQEVFLRAVRYIRSYRCQSGFGTWLYAISRNCCYNAAQLRSRRLVEYTLADGDYDVPDDRSVDAQTTIERQSNVRVVMGLLRSTLDETELRVMILHYANDQSLASITKQLRLKNMSGAKAYIVSAKRKLQAAMQRKPLQLSRKLA